MERFESIRRLRARLKELAVGQKADKEQRRLGSDLERRDAQRRVADRRAEITAALNLLHELRGSEHRHGVRAESAAAYAMWMDALRRDHPAA